MSWDGVDGRVRTTFPESQVNTLGMFYNGRTSRVDVSILNNETEPITVHFIGGAFQDIATLKPIQNVTSRSPTLTTRSLTPHTVLFFLGLHFFDALKSD
jgi:hypothetical protein